MPSSEVLLFGWKASNHLSSRIRLAEELREAFPHESWRLGVAWAPDLVETIRILHVSKAVDALYVSNEINIPHPQLVQSIYALAPVLQQRSDAPAVIFAKGYESYGQYFRLADIEIFDASAAKILQVQWRRRQLLTLTSEVVGDTLRKGGRE